MKKITEALMKKLWRVANTECDQDSDVSFTKDTDEVIDTAQFEEEHWIEHIKRSTATAVERMKAAQTPC